jgi:hypothetical protein
MGDRKVGLVRYKGKSSFKRYEKCKDDKLLAGVRLRIGKRDRENATEQLPQLTFSFKRELKFDFPLCLCAVHLQHRNAHHEDQN